MKSVKYTSFKITSILCNYLLLLVNIHQVYKSCDGILFRWLTNTLWYWSLIKHPHSVTVQTRDLSRARPVTSWYNWYSSLQDAFYFDRQEQLCPLQVSLRLND